MVSPRHPCSLGPEAGGLEATKLLHSSTVLGFWARMMCTDELTRLGAWMPASKNSSSCLFSKSTMFANTKTLRHTKIVINWTLKNYHSAKLESFLAEFPSTVSMLFFSFFMSVFWLFLVNLIISHVDDLRPKYIRLYSPLLQFFKKLIKQ